MQFYLKMVLCFFLIVFAPFYAVKADNRYISGDFEITMRTGPGSNRKIIALIPSGMQVEIIQDGEEWSKVQYRGKQGWVLTRYLTGVMPKSIKLKRLQIQYQKLLDNSGELEKKVSRFSQANKSLDSEVTQLRNDFNLVVQKYDTLKENSANYLNLKSEYEKVVSEVETLRKKSEKMEIEYGRLSKSRINTGMLYGGALVIIGIVLGFIFKRPKRRHSLI
ncbi:MAG: TIGR04211 family SH3 domain-containing protein [Desulfobacteraceae bacterium]|nr:TIGR04211 family SH3 domain-containing protein [Desulfobacteraceae bacterium]